MHRFLKFLGVTAFVAIIGAAPAKAETMTYEFEKPHTQVIFFADHLGFSHSEGKFLDFEGHLTLDTADPTKSEAEVTIQTDSLRMDTEKWEDHLKNEDFFNVAEFPVMVFKSTGIVMTGDDTADVTGDLTMLGVTKPVTLKTKLNKLGKHPMNNKDVAGFSATAMIDRSEWGMSYGLPMMSPEVEIRIEVEAHAMENGNDAGGNK